MAQVVIGGAKAQVDVADTPETRQRGLAGHSKLAPDHGMLFVFDKAGHYPFHMRGMAFPLDFVWVSADQQVVDITEHVPAQTVGLFAPPRSFQYVIELPAGFVAQHGISVGDDVTL